jgi:hypothetical protein
MTGINKRKDRGEDTGQEQCIKRIQKRIKQALFWTGVEQEKKQKRNIENRAGYKTRTDQKRII